MRILLLIKLRNIYHNILKVNKAAKKANNVNIDLITTKELEDMYVKYLNIKNNEK